MGLRGHVGLSADLAPCPPPNPAMLHRTPAEGHGRGSSYDARRKRAGVTIGLAP